MTFNADAFMSAIEDGAKEMLQESGELSPAAFLVKKESDKSGKPIVLFVPAMHMARGDVAKNAFVNELRKMCAENGVEEYFTIMDGWTLPEDVAKELGDAVRDVRPSTHPDRIGAIVMVHYHKTRGMRTRVTRYTEEEQSEGKKTYVFQPTMDSLKEGASSQYSRFNIWDNITMDVSEKEVSCDVVPQELRRVAERQAKSMNAANNKR
jgi:hypothetical protein